MEVIIESHSGFCFGVVAAINRVEELLQTSNFLYCLGDIVHNSEEMKRLKAMGLEVISVDSLNDLQDCSVLIRAHGEPPSTYALAKERNIKLIDATCPIVLKLQQKIRKGFLNAPPDTKQTVIFGKKGHAEVIGLQGQTQNKAIIISSSDEIGKIDFSKPIELFAQTTKSKEEYADLIEKIQENIPDESLKTAFKAHDTICGQVANRSRQLLKFIETVDVLLFVSGKKSSNGMYLYNLCLQHKPETYLLSNLEEFDPNWVRGKEKVGISGATSTPLWLMKQIAEACTSIK